MRLHRRPPDSLEIGRWLQLPREEARRALSGALRAGAADARPDLWLLAANLGRGTPPLRLAALNRMFRTHRLPGVALRDRSLPPAPNNLTCAGPVAPVGTGPRVSVLMTAHNCATRVDAAIRSVLSQSWTMLELVVVDDASDDGTWERIAALALGDARVRPVRLPHNLGTYAAKLIGLQHATGDLLTCHDADDWSHPLKLERQVGPLLQDRRLVASTSCWVRVADDGAFVARQGYPLTRWNPSSTLFRRDPVLRLAGAWDPVRTGADSEFLDRLKAVFGERAVHPVRAPLALGSHRPGSLMTDAVTGYDAQGRCASREAYGQGWRDWHARVRRRGSTPWIAPNVLIAASGRPFEAPPSLVVPPADVQVCQRTAGRAGFMDEPAHQPVWLATSRAVGQLATLAPLLDGPVRTDGWGAGRDRRLAGVLAWGRKPSAARAVRRADALGLPVRWIEDGFLRSFRAGAQQPPLSIVVDDTGVFYDASAPSALEARLNDPGWTPPPELDAQASRARALMAAHGLGKYNDAPTLQQVESASGRALLRPHDRERVLVVDQTAGDLSIACGGATARSFADMLTAALDEHPDATVYVKTHPETRAGTKAGHFRQGTDPRVVVLQDAIEPRSLLQAMDRVFVVTSTLGFEALLAGRPVTCFGMPWYAGWGVTHDRQRCARRTQQRTVQALFAAAYLLHARYIDPATHRRGTIFDVIAWLVHQRRMAGLLDPEGSGLTPLGRALATAPARSPA